MEDFGSAEGSKSSQANSLLNKTILEALSSSFLLLRVIFYAATNFSIRGKFSREVRTSVPCRGLYSEPFDTNVDRTTDTTRNFFEPVIISTFGRLNRSKFASSCRLPSIRATTRTTVASVASSSAATAAMVPTIEVRRPITKSPKSFKAPRHRLFLE